MLTALILVVSLSAALLLLPPLSHGVRGKEGWVQRYNAFGRDSGFTAAAVDGNNDVVAAGVLRDAVPIKVSQLRNNDIAAAGLSQADSFGLYVYSPVVVNLTRLSRNQEQNSNTDDFRNAIKPA